MRCASYERLCNFVEERGGYMRLHSDSGKMIALEARFGMVGTAIRIGDGALGLDIASQRLLEAIDKPDE